MFFGLRLKSSVIVVLSGRIRGLSSLVYPIVKSRSFLKFFFNRSADGVIFSWVRCSLKSMVDGGRLHTGAGGIV